MDNKSKNTSNEVVRALLDTKAVNFEAIGAAVAKYGASATVSLDFEDVFCGTMRRFIRVYRIVDPGTPVDDLPTLQGVSSELSE